MAKLNVTVSAAVISEEGLTAIDLLKVDVEGAVGAA